MFIRRLFEFSLNQIRNRLQSKDNLLIQQQKVLTKLLKKAAQTEFGQHYQFDKILSKSNPLQSYKKEVPFHDYDLLFNQWWYRALDGASNITWPGKIDYFSLSSGTSNATSKRIPISKDMFKMLQKAALGLYTSFPNFEKAKTIYTKTWLGISGTSQLNKVKDHYEGYMSGISALKQPFWAKRFYRPGDNISSITNFNKRTDLIAKQASQWDIGIIIGVPPWVLKVIEQILKENEAETLHEIWPNLNIFITGGVDYKPYQKSINKLAGKELTYINTYLASEGMIAYQGLSETNDMQLILNGGVFFEFVPFNAKNFTQEGNLKPQAKTYTIAEVDTKTEYALVLSTCSGVWRYLLGDTVRFTNVKNGSIVITGRTKDYLNLCAEHLSGDNIVAAIRQTEKSLNISISEFTVAPLRQGNYFKHHWYVGTSNDIDLKLIKSQIDIQLKSLNDDYKTVRSTVLYMDLELIPCSYFYEWQEAYNKAAGQSKMPKVIKGKALESWQVFLKQKAIAPIRQRGRQAN